MADRVKVACINWTYPGVVHAISYVLRDGEAIAERYHATWAEAMDRANGLAVALGLARGATPPDQCDHPAEHRFMRGWTQVCGSCGQGREIT